MFVELEPVFDHEGEVLEIDYSFALPDCEAAKSVRVRGRICNRAGIVSFRADARLMLDTVCDRCAEPVCRELVIPMDCVLVTGLNEEDNADFILVEDLHFDLDGLVRENIFLSLPSRILCSPDCRGLCPICGANLNSGACSCKKPVDPRLAVLAGLSEDGL